MEKARPTLASPAAGWCAWHAVDFGFDRVVVVADIAIVNAK
jgi:hypothetical protein